MKELVVYFNNGRMVRLPEDKALFVNLGQPVDEEYMPDTSDGKAVINWSNVCFVRAWQESEDDDD